MKPHSHRLVIRALFDKTRISLKMMSMTRWLKLSMNLDILFFKFLIEKLCTIKSREVDLPNILVPS